MRILLQADIDKRHLLVRAAALFNDTVGTLVARAYTRRQGCGRALLGVIFCAGTNGAYVELAREYHEAGQQG